MMRLRMRAAHLAVLLVLVSSGCSRGDPAAKHRLFAREEDRGTTRTFDPAHPEEALALDADEVAARLGSFEWTGAVEWSVARKDGTLLHVTEQHRLRQVSSGEFEVRADVDPGLGPSAVQGKQIVWVNQMTYARALPARFRERPTDRGRDARRFREDSFELARSVAALCGPRLKLEASGRDALLGREGLRYQLSLGPEDAKGGAAPPAPGFQAGDQDTALRQGFLRGAAPTAVRGELLVDAQTGAPLRVRLEATFAAPAPADAQPGPAVSVVVASQVKALGGEVKAIAAPSAALPDERKPAGPSPALEAAGLKKRGEEGPSAEPSDEGD
jgi:hypothetical protein